ncbi:Uma2 family endonuclease [Thermus sp.]|jgi:Uma2 family endonuclease|uniref:Uma2 family endonuclease n=1 Tax=Thermus sp. TaxID=275 RepID=UPI00321F7392
MIRHRLSLEEFQGLLEKAPEGLHLELLEGEVYEMAPIGSGHASLVTYLAKQLERLYGDRALVYVQNPLHLSPHSLPQPDLALLKPREDFYRAKLPEPEDVLLVVEVSFSTREVDLKKLTLYAQSGIPEVWLVEEGGNLEAYREPRGSHYRHRLLLEPGEEIAPLLLSHPPLLWNPPRGTPPA